MRARRPRSRAAKPPTVRGVASADDTSSGQVMENSWGAGRVPSETMRSETSRGTLTVRPSSSEPSNSPYQRSLPIGFGTVASVPTISSVTRACSSASHVTRV